MADCYYCKYAYKYASEMVYGLSCFAEIRDKKKLKIMSVGCGPCTELAAVDYLKKQGGDLIMIKCNIEELIH